MARKSKKKSKNRKKTSTVKKKISKKREKEQYPGLKKHLFSKIKQEYHDIDYADKLSDKEKLYLSNFMEEFLGARTNHSGKKIHKKLHTKAGRKKIFDANNARNRDSYSNAKARGAIVDVDPKIILEGQETTNPEDTIIECIDLKKLL